MALPVCLSSGYLIDMCELFTIFTKYGCLFGITQGNKSKKGALQRN
jgi:hypothetical protein